jgi:hypothetical protein
MIVIVKFKYVKDRSVEEQRIFYFCRDFTLVMTHHLNTFHFCLVTFSHLNYQCSFIAHSSTFDTYFDKPLQLWILLESPPFSRVMLSTALNFEQPQSFIYMHDELFQSLPDKIPNDSMQSNLSNFSFSYVISDPL